MLSDCSLKASNRRFTGKNRAAGSLLKTPVSTLSHTHTACIHAQQMTFNLHQYPPPNSHAAIVTWRFCLTFVSF